MVYYIKILSIVLISLFVLSSCSKKEESETLVHEEKSLPFSKDSINIEYNDQKAVFSLDDYIDSAKTDQEKTAAKFIRTWLIEGDYLEALNFLTEEARMVVENDSLSKYIFFDEVNPEWSRFEKLRYDLTKQYMSILVLYNKLADIKMIENDSVTKIEYSVQSPLTMNKIFDHAMPGEGKTKFDNFISDPIVSIDEKIEFYNLAFDRLRKMADSLDYITITRLDTLRMVKENSNWKVVRKGKNSIEIFNRN